MKNINEKNRMCTLAVFALLFLMQTVTGQVPQGFNYQAIARDGSGNPIVNATINVRLSILSDSNGFYPSGGGTYVWEETHSSVKTNAFGLFTIIMGNTLAVKFQGTAPTFSAINWSAGTLYIGTKIQNGGPTFKALGAAQLMTVPYAMVAGAVSGASGTLNKLAITSTTPIMDEALFEVKNQTGQTVFAVYNEGVRVYVDNGVAKGGKGGFAIGGFGTGKAASAKLLSIYPDSTNIYSKGSFTVQSYNAGMTNSTNLLTINPDSARIHVNETAVKGSKGGFAIGGFNPAKGGYTGEFMFLTPKNYFIGHSSGDMITTGQYNATLGYQSGMNLTSGNDNIFIGYQSGKSTNTGFSNVLIGTGSGFTNSSGYWNIMIGRQTGYNNSTGFSNIIIGDWAGINNTIGHQNVFIGDYAGGHNTTGNFNAFIGANSGNINTTGSYNSFIGFNSGINNLTGAKNTYLGYQAGYSGLNASGSNNIFLGVEAGYSNTTGHDNIAIGNLAGRATVGGNYNVMIGSESGNANIAGNYNSMLGYQSGSKQTGDYATLIGYQAGSTTTSGNSQTMVGYQAGVNNNGMYNTFVGVATGANSGTGAYNTYLGLAAGNAATGSGNVFIGKWAGWYETGSNKLIIESVYDGSDNANNALIYGDFSAKTLKINGSINSTDITASNDNPGLTGVHNVTQNWGVGVKGFGGYIGVSGESTLAGGVGYRFGVSGNASGGAINYGVYGSASGGTAYAGYFTGNVYYTGTLSGPSDRTLKKNIMPISGSLRKVLDLQGVTYEWKSQDELTTLMPSKGDNKKDPAMQFNFPQGTQLGVIAQDVEKVIPELVQTDPNGLKSVDYIKIIPLLIESIKEQQKTIEAQGKKIEELSLLVKQLLNK